MTQKSNKPKPDDRSDNAEKLEDMMQNTIENIEKSHETMKFSSEDAREDIKEKNRRREVSIEEMEQEIKDEYTHNEFN